MGVSIKRYCPNCDSEAVGDLDCPECLDMDGDYECENCCDLGYIEGVMECFECGHEFDEP